MITKEEILEKKQHGDIKTAGAIIGISEANAYKALMREGSKYHQQITNTLSKVIEMRMKLIAETKAV